MILDELFDAGKIASILSNPLGIIESGSVYDSYKNQETLKNVYKCVNLVKPKVRSEAARLLSDVFNRYSVVAFVSEVESEIEASSTPNKWLIVEDFPIPELPISIMETCPRPRLTKFYDFKLAKSVLLYLPRLVRVVDVTDQPSPGIFQSFLPLLRVRAEKAQPEGLIFQS